MQSLLALYQHIRIQDVLDVIIISTLIYVFLIWFKNTASRFVFVGITLLGLVYIIARSFHLYLTTIVLQGFFAILLIVLIVIFQEEIRSLFEKLAMWGAIRKRKTSQDDLSLHRDTQIIVETLNELASKKIGALIVIQGKDPLGRHLKGGYILNGQLSHPLLASIFDRHSIGHDGAVIIEEGKVWQFGCHLPLSLDTKKVGKLGLRHTAAIGMSERSDALCLVVSEENGKISMAQDSKLRGVHGATELTRIIERFYEDKSLLNHQKAHYYNWISKNTFEKVVAVLIAAVLWYSFGYQRDSVLREFSVSLEYRNIPKEWELEETRINEVQITLMGSSQAFYLFDAKTLKVSMDLSQIKEGKQDIFITRSMISLPTNLDLATIKPEVISITAHKLEVIDIPLKVKTIGSLPENFIMKSIEASPTSIKVLASKTIDRSKLIIWTEPIDLANITATLTLEPKIVAPPDVRLRNGQTPTVKVTITVEGRPPERQHPSR